MSITSRYVKTTTDDGGISEFYFDGEDRLHREDGPAVTERGADGSLVEKFYRHGQLFRPDVPAPAIVERNGRTGAVTDCYARDGKVYLAVIHPRRP